jgi:hypothetical protein
MDNNKSQITPISSSTLDNTIRWCKYPGEKLMESITIIQVHESGKRYFTSSKCETCLRIHDIDDHHLCKFWKVFNTVPYIKPLLITYGNKTPKLL